MNSFNQDEPRDVPGVRQIIKNDDGRGNQAQAWTGVPELTREELWRTAVINGLSLPRSVPTVIADCVVWLSVAAIISKSVALVNFLIQLGLVAELPAAISLGLLGFIALMVVWIVMETVPKAYTLLIYRCSLFLAGVILGILP